MKNKAKRQIAIVGGGPVGVALAVELGLRGICCTLVESRTGLQQIPKGQNLTQRTLEHFYFWGVVDEIRAARVMPRVAPAAPGPISSAVTVGGARIAEESVANQEGGRRLITPVIGAARFPCP